MAKSLVVVESPAKAKTINKYLGKDFKVVASMGHIRDLPKSKLGVDVDEGFAPAYEAIPGRKKVIKELRAAAKNATDIYVATDPDREGEAIGWHLASELGGKKKKIHRLTFNEITKKAILEALEHPGDIDQQMVDAQQARRVLDRLVGYKLSPLLWDKVRRGLSAGRVQSVALRLVCDREEEISRFKSEEYWHIFARLAADQPPEFDAKLTKKDGETIAVGNEAESKVVLDAVADASFVVSKVATKERKKSAAPPFITSKLQQASKMPVKRTMMIAQQLYEGIELPGEGAVGLITYMRTDSTRVSAEAIDDARNHIASTFGDDFVPKKPNTFRTKKNTQDAHEAIRPTSMQYGPETVKPHLSREQYTLYRMIWNRFVASQMLPARFDDTTVDIDAAAYTLRVKGSVLKFNGWMAAHGLAAEEKADEVASPTGDANGQDDAVSGALPAMQPGDRLELKQLRPEQKFTQPPPRFSEATLVKELEENGIGRPSTYAAIIGVLQAREYVEKIEGRFKPTRLGSLVTDLLAKSFDDILAVEYTRDLEESLDKIEGGDADYRSTIENFYGKFSVDLTQAAKSMPNIKAEGLPSEEVCDKCKSPMVVKVGRFGMFLACSSYPDCQNTRELETADTGPDEEAEACENCGKPMVVKRGRFGQFLACSGYPDCKTTRKLIATKEGLAAAKPDQMLDEKCPRCESNLVIKHGRFGEFTACSSYPKCRYVKLKPTGVACPKDGGDIVERKSRRGRAFYGCSNYPDCDFTLWNKPLIEPCPECKAPFLVEKVTKRHGRQLLCHKEECDYVRSEELAAV
ncbi:MAG: type I DNA topoisomerase [Vicinamibacterales bacterium]|jgi:DNA topoisomerase-1|nr:DNA topoisomerase I [Acidobacteriota bacterium]MDP6374174.1 type I DNA topoisomerase [Vicinamibacterales bacterium]MDP6610238.1 type I DNA topoisomerase [Vicinamibacterales bacterium]HAK55253.1 type I DNA topoisomerase [Acidobacteriota bacterium]|tara:strand:- start:5468 stop:7882 length:2415 start_codon:yes stop_codon:yes gene_type:complete